MSQRRKRVGNAFPRENGVTRGSRLLPMSCMAFRAGPPQNGPVHLSSDNTYSSFLFFGCLHFFIPREWRMLALVKASVVVAIMSAQDCSPSAAAAAPSPDAGSALARTSPLSRHCLLCLAFVSFSSLQALTFHRFDFFGLKLIKHKRENW